MTDSSLQIAPDFKLSGIKFSNELVQFDIFRQTSVYDDWVAELLANIALRRINIPFLRHSSDDETTLCFCVEKNQETGTLRALHQLTDGLITISTTPQTGLVTLFPHRSSFVFLSKVLEIFSTNNFPIYALATSVSNLSINTSFALLDDVSQKIQQYFPLPGNHAPFRQELRIEQVFPTAIPKTG